MEGGYHLMAITHHSRTLSITISFHFPASTNFMLMLASSLPSAHSHCDSMAAHYPPKPQKPGDQNKLHSPWFMSAQFMLLIDALLGALVRMLAMQTNRAGVGTSSRQKQSAAMRRYEKDCKIVVIGYKLFMAFRASSVLRLRKRQKCC